MEECTNLEIVLSVGQVGASILGSPSATFGDSVGMRAVLLSQVKQGLDGLVVVRVLLDLDDDFLRGL
jgi:hypothetical protein